MKNTNKRSEGYKTRAEKKKEKKELKKKSQMEKKFLVGIYDSYRTGGSLNSSLNKLTSKLVGTYSTEPIYDMYILEKEENCVIKTNGNSSVKIEIWEVNEAVLGKIERSYSYYSNFEEYPQDYVKEKVLSPFGEIIIYFTNVSQSKDNIIINGDWIEHLNYKKVMGNKKENVL